MVEFIKGTVEKLNDLGGNGFGYFAVAVVILTVSLLICDLVLSIKCDKADEDSKLHTVSKVITIITIIEIAAAISVSVYTLTKVYNRSQEEKKQIEEKYTTEEKTTVYEYRVNNGYVTVKYIGDKLNLIVVAEKIVTTVDEETGEEVKQLDDNEYNCYIYKDGEEHNILLSRGTGEYFIGVYECEGETANKIKEYRVKYEEENEDLYKLSSYNVEKDIYSDSINEIIGENGWNREVKMEEVFNYFKDEYEYDYDTEKEINEGKISHFDVNLSATYEDKSGVCKDLAALETAVLRELGYSARLQVGKSSKNSYHAWCEVMVDGKWKNMDTLTRSEYNNGETKLALEIIQTY